MFAIPKLCASRAVSSYDSSIPMKKKRKKLFARSYKLGSFYLNLVLCLYFTLSNVMAATDDLAFLIQHLTNGKMNF